MDKSFYLLENGSAPPKAFPHLLRERESRTSRQRKGTHRHEKGFPQAKGPITAALDMGVLIAAAKKAAVCSCSPSIVRLRHEFPGFLSCGCTSIQLLSMIHIQALAIQSKIQADQLAACAKPRFQLSPHTKEYHAFGLRTDVVCPTQETAAHHTTTAAHTHTHTRNTNS